MSKILVLSYLPIYPTNGGGRVRIRQLATHLAERHEVTLVCPPFEEPPKEAFPFTVRDNGVRGVQQLFDPRAYRSIIETVRRERPDYILLEYVWQGLHAGLARLAQHIPVVLDAFDVATVRFRRTRHPLWPIVSLLERCVLRAADSVFAVSEQDREQLIKLGASAQTTSVVPNGVDTSQFRPDPNARRRIRRRLGIRRGERLLFFFGQLDYPPNAEAVRVLAQEVMPRLDEKYRLAIAGRGSVAQLRETYGGGRIEFLGPVEELPDYINAADAVVAPILQGSGTRLKLIESVACGAPTVTTSIGAEGLDLAACAPSLTIANDWDSFADQVRRAARAKHIPPSPAFLESYDWRAIVGRIRL
ncbi:MAG: glycosyltransferase family 4 protein [Chloroflexi bacterium]|nr:glycosyltransferase family 4 protein [Chloroflexota bacterium]